MSTPPTKYAQEKWTSTGQNDLLQLVSEKAGDIILGGIDYLGIRYGSLAGANTNAGTQIVSLPTVVNVSGPIPQQTFYVVTSNPDLSGQYRVSIDLICTTPGAAGTVVAEVQWSNGTTTAAFTSGYLDLSTIGEVGAASGNFYVAPGQNISFFTTVVGGVGSVYSLRIVLESLINVSSATPSAGVSSLNTLTGGLSLISSDNTLSITPLGSVINLKVIGGGGGGGPNFSDSEIPAGSLPGTSFTLAHNPNPAASLILVWNGIVLENGVGYTLSGGNTITMSQTVQTTDTLVCWYRY